MSQGLFRLRVRWGKQGRLAFLSHLEIARALERIVRRADLPYALSQGFNPHMRIAFGPALPVGTGGDSEYFDVWLTEYIAPDRVLVALRDAAPGDLAMEEVAYVASSEPSLSAVLTIAEYVLKVDGDVGDAESLRSAVDAAIEAGTLTVEHKGKVREHELTTALVGPVTIEHLNGTVRIRFAIRSGAGGSLRPERFVVGATGGLIDQGGIRHLHKTGSLIEVEPGRFTDGFGREVE